MATSNALFNLFDHEGPFTTVVLPTPSAIDNADARLELEWKNARSGLHGDIPPAALEAIDKHLAGGHRGGHSLFLCVAADGTAQARRMSVGVDRAAVWLTPLPRLGTALQWEQSLIPHVIVLTDREGADLLAVVSGEEAMSEEVDGRSEHIHRSHPGGWSQRRYQQRAENTWESNARAVAEEVVALVDRFDARLVVAAGDVRAMQFLRDHLPDRVDGLLRPIDGSRHADVDALAEDAVTMVLTVAAEERRDLLRAFADARGEGRAVDGPADTLEALREGRVATLMVHDDPADDRQAWFVPETGQVAANRGDFATGSPTEARLVDVAMRAAHQFGADIVMVPGTAASGPAEAIGAVLRF